MIEAEGLWVMPGLIDLHVHLRDPGLEYKETLHTGAMAAAKRRSDHDLRHAKHGAVHRFPGDDPEPE